MATPRGRDGCAGYLASASRADDHLRMTDTAHGPSCSVWLRVRFAVALV